MKHSTLINVRVLSACITLLLAHSSAMAYVHDHRNLSRLLLYPLVLLALITLAFCLTRPVRK
ncbi:hypothetical protein [Spirosoma areae]